MLVKQQLHGYQTKAIEHIKTHPRSMLWLDLGLGKASGNNEPVLTPTGWTPMGELRVGDQVIGSNGQPTDVLGVFPQGEVEIVKVTFTDGSWTRVTWDHLWYVETSNQRKRKQVGHVMTTSQLVEQGLYYKGDHIEGTPKWYIPMVEPVTYKPLKKPLPIDPYLLGVILGDAYILPSGEVRVTSDEEILDQFFGNSRPHPSEGIVEKTIPGLRPIMRHLELNGKRSWEKHIPKNFLRGSVQERLSLLQGLLDTEGSPIDKGGVEFSSTSEYLTDGVVELVQSLGGIAKKKGSRVTQYQNGEGRHSWRVNVKLPGEFTPFRLQRKLDKWTRSTKHQPVRK